MKPTHRNPLLRKFLLASSILLSLGGSASADSLVWKGSDLTNPTFWDTETTTNWLNTGTTLADVFCSGDTVLFNDDHALTSPILVAIQAAVSPGGTTFDNDLSLTNVSGAAINSGNLTFSGDGTVTLASAFGGAGNLSVNGAGTVLLNAVNTYTGTTTITSGWVELGNNAALGTTDGGTSISGTGTLDIKARALGTEAFTISGEGDGTARSSTPGRSNSMPSAASLSPGTPPSAPLVPATPDAGTSGTPAPPSTWAASPSPKKETTPFSSSMPRFPIPATSTSRKAHWGSKAPRRLAGGSATHTLTIRSGAFLHFYRTTGTLDWKMAMEDSSRIYAEQATAATQNT